MSGAFGPTRFAFRFPNGRIEVGPVMGAGGFVQSAERIKLAKARAAEGKRTNLYEPLPGHLACYPQYTHEGNGPPEPVPAEGFIGEAKWVVTVKIGGKPTHTFFVARKDAAIAYSKYQAAGLDASLPQPTT